jgi:CBS domain-containing protein
MANYQLRARDLMQTDIATILPDLTVQDAAFLMRHYGVRSLIVEKDSDDDAYGIITFADVVGKVLAYGFDPAEVSVAEVMTKPLVVLNPSLKADLIAKLFAKHSIGHAPVIENHKLVGMVSLTDLIVEVIPDPVIAPLALPARKPRSLPAPKATPAKKPTKRRQKAKVRHP